MAKLPVFFPISHQGGRWVGGLKMSAWIGRWGQSLTFSSIVCASATQLGMWGGWFYWIGRGVTDDLHGCVKLGKLR